MLGLLSFLGGAILGFGIQEIKKMIERKGPMKGIAEIKKARKERNKIFLCETKNAFWLVPEAASYHNLSLSDKRDVIVVAPNSIKPVYSLGGVQLGVADLYRSCTIPQELRQTIVFLKLIGLKDKDIKKYLSKIHGVGVKNGESAVEEAEKFLEKKIDELIKNEKDKNKKELLEIIKKKKEIYLATPSTIVEFLQTGLNRVTLKAQLKQIVDEKMLEKLRKTDWFQIGLMIFLILIGIWLVFGGGHGVIETILNTGTSVIAPR